MEIDHFIERERQERAAAVSARSAAARAEHLDLAERYRAVVEALNRVAEAAPARPRPHLNGSSRLQPPQAPEPA